MQAQNEQMQRAWSADRLAACDALCHTLMQNVMGNVLSKAYQAENHAAKQVNRHSSSVSDKVCDTVQLCVSPLFSTRFSKRRLPYRGCSVTKHCCLCIGHNNIILQKYSGTSPSHCCSSSWAFELLVAVPLASVLGRKAEHSKPQQPNITYKHTCQNLLKIKTVLVSMCHNPLKLSWCLQAVFFGWKRQCQQRQHAEVAAAAQIHQMQRRIMAAVALAWSQTTQHRVRERALLAHAQQKTQRKMLVHCFHTLKHYASFHIALSASLQDFQGRCKAKKLQTVFQAWLEMAQYKRWRDTTAAVGQAKAMEIAMAHAFNAWRRHACCMLNARQSDYQKLQHTLKHQITAKAVHAWRGSVQQRHQQRAMMATAVKHWQLRHKGAAFGWWVHYKQTVQVSRVTKMLHYTIVKTVACVGLTEMHKTGCCGGTRLVLHIPSSS